MGRDQGQVGTAVDGGQNDPEVIRREIEETRQELGETAAALAAKTDVKARARDKVDEVKQTIADKTESLPFGNGSSSGTSSDGPSVTTQAKSTVQSNPIPAAAIAAFVGGMLFGRITKR